ncbi:WD repeat-containing protein 48-like [Schistocerca gregaria]|uniref:WD repeat-containing protein 48-like n=1 Tax=Schistocerca gregaria TaxID=7010 RepID=UPI00211EE5CC|nr:WD repeat-containing protein 48-like [Schistocerca gregaria]
MENSYARGVYSKNRISYSFPRKKNYHDENGNDLVGHCFGVNAIACDQERSIVYSAGRDTTIRAWNYKTLFEDTGDCIRDLGEWLCDSEGNDAGQVSQNIGFMNCFEYHNDWVNDISLLQRGTKLVSCSNDCNLIMAPLEFEGDSVKLKDRVSYIDISTDYVKKVKCFEKNGSINLFSMGFDRNIRYFQIPQSGDAISVHEMSVKYSPYSMAVEDRGSYYLIAVGGTESHITFYETRTEKKIRRLKGNTDNIKALLLDQEKDQCISGTSGGFVNVWDFRSEGNKPIKTLRIHEDSVWCFSRIPQDLLGTKNFAPDSPLSAPESSSWLVSGGRDGKIFLTELEKNVNILFCRDLPPVLSLLPLSERGGSSAPVLSIWASTSEANVFNWMLQPQEKGVESYSAPLDLEPPPSVRPDYFSAFCEVNDVLCVQEPESMRPVLTKEEARVKTPSSSYIVDYHILNDKRHILTKDSDNRVHLWNVLSATVEKDYGKACVETVLEELNRKVYVPSWFTVEKKAGSLNIVLNPADFLNSHVSLMDLGIRTKGGVSLGLETLRSLFRTRIGGQTAAHLNSSAGSRSSSTADQGSQSFKIHSLSSFSSAHYVSSSKHEQDAEEAMSSSAMYEESTHFTEENDSYLSESYSDTAHLQVYGEQLSGEKSNSVVHLGGYLKPYCNQLNSVFNVSPLSYITCTSGLKCILRCRVGDAFKYEVPGWVHSLFTAQPQSTVIPLSLMRVEKVNEKLMPYCGGFSKKEDNAEGTFKLCDLRDSLADQIDVPASSIEFYCGNAHLADMEMDIQSVKYYHGNPRSDKLVISYLCG